MKDSRLEYPTVCVLMLTYNQEKYVAEAIEGVFNQETNFPIELIICNDASTDSTDKIINKFISGHPKGNLIKYYLNESNSGMMGNFIFSLGQCNGKYIAVCEGDDYWTDPLKLQRQVDFLETNPDYFICHHGFKVLNEEGQLLSAPDQKEIPLEYEIDTLSKRNTIGTLTVMYRNNFSLPAWFSTLNYGDYPTHLLNARQGKIKFFPEEMAVYRRHRQSITGSFKSIESPLFLLQPLEVLRNFFVDNVIVKKNLSLQILNLYIAIFFHYYELKDNLNSNLYFNKIRELKTLFQEKELNKNPLIQIYLDRIKDCVRLNDNVEINSLIGDFQDETIEFMLKAYAKEVSFSDKLKRSKSYRLGNKLIDPFFQALSAIKGQEKKAT